MFKKEESKESQKKESESGIKETSEEKEGGLERREAPLKGPDFEKMQQ